MRSAQPGRSRDGWLAGLLLSLAPIPPVLHSAITHVAPSGWHWAPIGTASAFIAIAGVLLLATRSGGRVLATAGILLTVGSFGVQLATRPGPAFFVGVLVMAILSRLWSDPPLDDPRPDALSMAKGALLPAILVWFVVGPGAVTGDSISVACALITGGLAELFTLIALLRGAVRAPALYVVLPLATIVLLAGMLRLHHEDALAAAPLLVLLILLFSGERQAAQTPETFWEQLLANPAPLLVATFVALGLTGAILLWIPVSTTHLGGIDFIDSLFTSISACCVTGLIVLDTPVDFTFFGQATIAVLIQVGGLGIMTFSTATLALLRRRASMRHERALADLIGAEGREETMRAVREILIVTFTAELIGATVLAFRFVVHHGDPVGRGIWRACFTAISAFCNAGFALQSDNLITYQNDPIVLHAVAALVLLGGLGPAIVVVLPGIVRRGRFNAYQALVLVTTAFLLVAPFVAFSAIEWNNTLAGLSIPARLHNAWLQVVSPRTAGFNSIDTSGLHPATVLMMMALMFIGGSPGSTAGGIKTTSFAILFLGVVSVMRGAPYATVHLRRISHRTVYKAIAVTACGFIVIGAASTALLLTQDIEPMTAIFEVISALGTVGLSLGATSQLDVVGKVVIIGCMFAGRVGPLTLLLLLREPESGARWTLPEEQIPVG